MTMSKIIFGIDVGGTTCKCGTFSEEGELLRKEEIPTRKDEGGSLILPDISEYIKGVLADMNMTTEDVAGIGMGLPGFQSSPLPCCCIRFHRLPRILRVLPYWHHYQS